MEVGIEAVENLPAPDKASNSSSVAFGIFDFTNKPRLVRHEFFP
jgi:hypothetical protein